jgi:hypothetical protein
MAQHQASVVAPNTLFDARRFFSLPCQLISACRSNFLASEAKELVGNRFVFSFEAGLTQPGGSLEQQIKPELYDKCFTQKLQYLLSLSP